MEKKKERIILSLFVAPRKNKWNKFYFEHVSVRFEIEWEQWWLVLKDSHRWVAVLVTEHKQINVTNNQRIYLYLKFLDRKVFVELHAFTRASLILNFLKSREK